MKKGKNFVFPILIYFLIWFFCWGALMADIQSIGDKDFANRHYRQDLSFTCLVAAVPGLNVLVAVFGTGFMEYGWRLSRRKD